LADEAVAIAGSRGDDAIRVRVLNHISVPLLVPSLLEQSLTRSAEALVLAERVGDPAMFFWSAVRRAHIAARAGDIDELDRCIEIAGSLAEQLDQPTANWAHTWQRATRALIAGDTDEAEQLATAALQIGTDGGEPDASLFYGVQLMTVSWQRGTLGELVPLIEQMAAEVPDFSPLAVKGGVACAHVEADRFDAARVVLEEFEAVDFDLPLDSVWHSGMVYYSEAAIECRDQRFAGPLFYRLAPWADQLATNGGPSVEGPVSHFLGGLAAVLGRYDEADTYFAQSAAMNDRLGAKFFAARTDIIWGRMLAERRASGDAEKARGHLTKAQSAAVANGYATVERRAAAALRLLDD
jgi:tetratricopeptide (TPR) repeat protein